MSEQSDQNITESDTHNMQSGTSGAPAPSSGFRLERRLKFRRKMTALRRYAPHPEGFLLILVVVLFSVWYLGYYRPSVIIPRQQYKEASDLMSERQWDDARKILTDLGEYRDSARLIQECDYQKAEDLLSEGRWSEAQKLFDSLGSYSDSGERSLACDYFHGLLLAENEEYEEAAAVFGSLSDYGDSPRQVLCAWYRLGCQEEDAGNEAKARECYRNAGDYEDAAQRLAELS